MVTLVRVWTTIKFPSRTSSATILRTGSNITTPTIKEAIVSTLTNKKDHLKMVKGSNSILKFQDKIIMYLYKWGPNRFWTLHLVPYKFPNSSHSRWLCNINLRLRMINRLSSQSQASLRTIASRFKTCLDHHNSKKLLFNRDVISLVQLSTNMLKECLAQSKLLKSQVW